MLIISWIVGIIMLPFVVREIVGVFTDYEARQVALTAERQAMRDQLDDIADRLDK
jgi:hypothetical protein